MDKLGKYLDTWGDEFRQGRAVEGKPRDEDEGVLGQQELHARG